MFRVENTLKNDWSELNIELRFRSIGDFEPEEVARQVEPLRRLLGVRNRLASLLALLLENPRLEELTQRYVLDTERLQKLQEERGSRVADVPRSLGPVGDDGTGNPNAQEDDWEEVEVDWDEPSTTTDLLDAVIAESRFTHSHVERKRARDLIGEFVEQVLDGEIQIVGDRVHQQIRETVSQIDSWVSSQLSRILHHAEFQKLHGTWLGIRDVVRRSAPGVEIRILHATKRDLFTNMLAADSVADTELYRKVYRQGYDTFGAAPFAILVGDYEFTDYGSDVDLLSQISRVAAAAHSPFLVAATAEFLGLRSLAEISRIPDLSTVFSAEDFDPACRSTPEPAKRAVRPSKGPASSALSNDQEAALARLGLIPLTQYRGKGAVVFRSVPSCREADPIADGIDDWQCAPDGLCAGDVSLRSLSESNSGS